MVLDKISFTETPVFLQMLIVLMLSKTYTVGSFFFFFFVGFGFILVFIHNPK